MDPNQFAQTIKQKYPQYNNVDNLTLAQKVVSKYPQYASKVNFQNTDQSIGNPSFPAQQNESLGTVAEKTLGNVPSSAFNFAKGAVESLNPVSTLDKIGQIITPNQDPNAPKVNPLDVIKELPNSAYKLLVPQFLQHLISGNVDNAQKTIENDPVGQIAPLLLAAEGGAKALDTYGGGMKAAAENNATNFSNPESATYGKNVMPQQGIYSQAFDNGISTAAQPFTNAISSTLGKVGSLSSGGTLSAASHITGLDPQTITSIIQNPEAFTKIAQDNINRGGLAGEVKSAIDQRIADLSSLGKGYEGIKNMDGQVNIPQNLVTDTLKSHGVELVDGKVKVGPESIPLSQGDINALQHFVDTYGNEPTLSNNAFLNTRSALSNMSAYDATKTNNIKVISRGLRSAYDNVGKDQIPGLKELDNTYAPETQFLKQVKKDYLNKDGTFKDGAVNKIANSTGVGKENLLNRLENVMPGVTKRVQILKAVEDIERAKGIKIGNYGRIAVGGIGGLAGGIPGAIIAEIITSPTIAVPLLKGLGYTNAKLIPILQTLKALAGDPKTAALFVGGITNQPVETPNAKTENNPVGSSINSPYISTPSQKEPRNNK